MRYESFWKDLIRVLDFPNLMLNFMINLVMQFKNFIYYEIRKMSITKTYTEKSEVMRCTTKPCHISQKSFIWKPYVLYAHTRMRIYLRFQFTVIIPNKMIDIHIFN